MPINHESFKDQYTIRFNKEEDFKKVSEWALKDGFDTFGIFDIGYSEKVIIFNTEGDALIMQVGMIMNHIHPDDYSINPR